MLAYISASRPGEERTRSLSAAWSDNHANGRFSRGYAWDSLRRLVLPDPDAAPAGLDRARRRRGERPRRAEQQRVALSHRRRRDRGHCHVHDHYQRWGLLGRRPALDRVRRRRRRHFTRLARRRPPRLAPRRVPQAWKLAPRCRRRCALLPSRTRSRPKQATVRHPGGRHFPESALAQSGERAFLVPA
jgi:hypothetical protein